MPAGSVSGEDPLPGLQMASPAVSSHDGERAPVSLPLLIRALVLAGQGPPYDLI